MSQDIPTRILENNDTQHRPCSTIINEGHSNKFMCFKVSRKHQLDICHTILPPSRRRTLELFSNAVIILLENVADVHIWNGSSFRSSNRKIRTCGRTRVDSDSSPETFSMTIVYLMSNSIWLRVDPKLFPIVYWWGKEHLQERERAVLFIFMSAYDQCSKTQFVLPRMHGVHRRC